MNISRRALVLLLWPAFCGLVVGGGLGFITGSLSAGLLFAGIAAVVSLLILNGWDMENIAGSDVPSSDLRYVDPAFSHLAGNLWDGSDDLDGDDSRDH